jgi:mono/diheme cytochrome c family protein
MLIGSTPVLAETPRQILDALTQQAGEAASAARGEKLYRAKSGSGGEAESCSACHTDDAKARGRHAKTHKEIEPLAPVANKERFTDPAKVEKWFKRNCKEVLGRACSPQEKADFAAYLISLK